MIEICSDAINHCIQEKENKVKPYFENYGRWWLLLVDHMSYTKAEDYTEIVKNINKPIYFERVIVINYDGSSKNINFELN